MAIVTRVTMIEGLSYRILYAVKTLLQHGVFSEIGHSESALMIVRPIALTGVSTLPSVPHPPVCGSE